jgi:acyl dehydratase
MAIKKFPIEAGHILLFARAIGDPNPIYCDEERAKQTEPGGIIAPPTFVQASAQFDDSYPLRPRIGEPWLGSGRNPTGVERRGSGGGGGGLHAEQHYEYHRVLRPGDVLRAETIPGKTWEKQGRRGGKLLFSELVTEFRDQRGELVVTARSIGVKTERVVEEG